jgi:hypothetical protein
MEALFKGCSVNYALSVDSFITRAFNRQSPAVAYAVRSIERLLTEEPRLGELLTEVEREFGPKCWDHGEDQKKRPPQHE